MIHRLRPWHAALAAGLVAGAVAAPAVANSFVEDDHWVVEQRPLLHHPPSIAVVLAVPYWPASFGGSLWRPAVLASYAADYRLSSRPAWFHVVNGLWAVAAAAALALLAAMIADPPIGLTAGLLFAVHPVHVEAVANVVGRAELMAATGYALALLCALHAERHRAWLGGVVLGAALAIASKESAATLPIALVLLVVARGRSVRAALPAIACAAAPVVLYFALRPLVVQGGTFGTGGLAPGLGGLGLMARGWGMLPLSLVWMRLSLWPLHLSADYSPAYAVISTGLTAWHVAAVALWGGAAWGAWRLRHLSPWPLVGLVWFGVTIAPVSNVLVPTELLVAERTLYLPSWGVALALATLLSLLPWRRAARAGLVGVLVVLGAWRSVTRAPVWHDDATFAAALERDAPTSYRSLRLAALDAFDANHWGSGERLLRQAIAAAPEIPAPKEDLARRYEAAGLWEPAATLLAASIADDSSRNVPWLELPEALLRAGHPEDADAVARAATLRLPLDDALRRNAIAVHAATHHHR